MEDWMLVIDQIIDKVTPNRDPPAGPPFSHSVRPPNKIVFQFTARREGQHNLTLLL